MFSIATLIDYLHCPSTMLVHFQVTGMTFCDSQRLLATTGADGMLKVSYTQLFVSFNIRLTLLLGT